ncbi:MAG: hypothetical protein HYR56_21925 [Acidobacteria bacterium]|nr:hypothetical protein [Acidobacteriota bacterium]MBI3421579.1 hypothetical protein [Acidobacteriota bacterium]
MLVKFLKASLLSLFALFTVICGVFERGVKADLDGAPASRTGAPNEQTCAASGCHTSFAVNSGSGSVKITGLPANGYTTGQDVTLTVTVAQTGVARFGFELTVLDDQGRPAGTLTASDTARTRRVTAAVNGAQRQYITHSQAGNTASTWTMRWTPPAQTAGRVTFYAAGNATNSNGQPTGDYIYTTTASLQPVSSVAAVAALSAASFAANGALPAESIAALFGANLAGTTLSANTLPLPTNLGGVVVRVKDAAGVERDAPLFFVSPAQVNFMVPASIGDGAATISVLRDGSTVGQGTVSIAALAPGLFTANSNGQGVAAAVAFRLKADGSQSVEPLAQFNQTAGRFEPLPLDLGPETDQVFLIGFGTAFRNRAALSSVLTTIGGTNAEVLFAGAQGDLAGLDQTNIRIPRSLAGRGEVNVNLQVDGKNANTVTISLK